MVDAAPFDLLGDAEALEDASQRAAGMEAGKVVGAGVETIEAGFPLIAFLAQKIVAETAGDDMGFVDRDF